MEFVQANQDTARKNKQVSAITNSNSFSRIYLIFEIIFERWKEFKEEKKQLNLGGEKPGAEKIAEREANFRIFYLTQGYMLSLVIVDITTNLTIILLSLKIIWQLINVVVEDKILVTIANYPIVAWWIHLTDIFSRAFDPFVTAAKVGMTNVMIGNFVVSKTGVFDIIAPLMMILSMYIVSNILLRTIRTNVIELLT